MQELWQQIKQEKKITLNPPLPYSNNLKFVPQGDKMVSVKTITSKAFIPSHARFKAMVYWANSGIGSYFPSWEIVKKVSEKKGLQELIERCCKKRKVHTYSSICVYATLGNNLSVKEKNYNFEVCVWTDGKEIRNQELIWGMLDQLDLHAMIKKYPHSI